MSYTPGNGGYPASAQQQRIQPGQQAFQAQQLGVPTSAFSNATPSQQDWMANLTPQQIQALLTQKNNAMAQGVQNNQFPRSNMMPQMNTGMSMGSMMMGMSPAATQQQPQPQPQPQSQPQSQPQPQQQPGMNNLLADLVNKTKAGLLSPVQLAQLRAVLEQQTGQTGQTVQQPTSQKPMMSNPMATQSTLPPAMQQAMQAMSMKQPMMVQNQQHSSPNMQQLNSLLNAANMQQQRPMQPQPQHQQSQTQPQQPQQQQQPTLMQGLQFIQKIQQRITEVEQKLVTTINESERQALQHSRQELLRVQSALIQKLTQGSQMQQHQTTSQQPQPAPQPQPNFSVPLSNNNLMSPSMTNFAQPNFRNPSTSKSPINLMNNAASTGPNMSPVQSMQVPQSMGTPAQTTPMPSISITPDQFKRVLLELLHRHKKPIQLSPVVNGRPIDLYQLFTVVQSLGGSKATTQKGQWVSVMSSLGFVSMNQGQVAATALQIAQVYKNYLELFEEVWQRAMMHQMSMSNNVQMLKNNVPDAMMAAANQSPMQMHQNPMQASQRFELLMQQNPHNNAQIQSLQGAQRPPMQDAQQSSVHQAASEPNDQLLPSSGSSFSQNVPKPSHNNTKPVMWPAEEQKSTQSMAIDREMERNNSSTKEKQKRPTIRVTSRMLEDARALLSKVDLSLSMSRPKLPVIEDISESEKNSVLQQVEQLVTLKTTVSALLPVFLAMTQNLEPAKRVKIMIYIFEDQIALLPERKCILRLSDLEKLKVQMTRCIGFVRIHDEKLAQKVMAKTFADQPEFSGQKIQETDESTASDNATRPSPLKLAGLAPSQKSRKNEGDDEDVEITGTIIRSPNKGEETASQTTQINQSTDDRDTSHLTDSPKLAGPESIQSMLNRTVDKVLLEQNQYSNMALTSPVEFVEKAWNELITTETQFKSSKIHGGLGKDIGWPFISLESLVYAAMDVPYQLGLHEGSLKSENPNGKFSNDLLFSALEQHNNRQYLLNTLDDMTPCSFTNVILCPQKKEQSWKDKNDLSRDTNEKQKSDWWSNTELF